MPEASSFYSRTVLGNSPSEKSHIQLKYSLFLLCCCCAVIDPISNLRACEVCSGNHPIVHHQELSSACLVYNLLQQVPGELKGLPQS